MEEARVNKTIRAFFQAPLCHVLHVCCSDRELDIFEPRSKGDFDKDSQDSNPVHLLQIHADCTGFGFLPNQNVLFFYIPLVYTSETE